MCCFYIIKRTLEWFTAEETKYGISYETIPCQQDDNEDVYVHEDRSFRDGESFINTQDENYDLVLSDNDQH